MPQAPHRILVIEDDPSISMGLEMNLEAEGYAVTVCNDGEQGYELATGGAFDLIVLDVMLPKKNGFEILRALSRGGPRHAPIIMLSARGAEMDKVMGLELGAEDYITKPFGLAELLARVKKVLRRGERGDESGPLAFDDLTIDPRTREIRRRPAGGGEGELVELTATEFDVLMCLVEAKGRVLSREQIQDEVWGEHHHGTVRTIDNFLLQLRQKLELDPQRPRHLVTVRGVGYRFVR